MNFTLLSVDTSLETSGRYYQWCPHDVEKKASWHEAIGQLSIPPQFMEYRCVVHTQRTLE